MSRTILLLLVTIFSFSLCLNAANKRPRITRCAAEKPTLVLYQNPQCPFCQKVFRYLDKIGKTLPMKDVRAHPEFKSELVQLGGKGQVPCLMINRKALYESDDIISWLSQHQNLLEPKRS